MRAGGRLLPLIAAGAILAACGGGTSGPNTLSAAPPPPATGANTVTISPFGGSTGATTSGGGGQAVFPAETPTGVLDLAAQHPDGRVRYATALDGAQGEMTIARLGDRAAIAVTDGAETIRVGIDLRADAIAWVCSEPADGAPTCAKRDASHRGADALAFAARLIGDERLREITASAAAASDAAVEVRRQANGVDASCVSGSGAGGAYLVCVSPSGFVTDAEGDGAIARALRVEATVSAADVAEPTSG